MKCMGLEEWDKNLIYEKYLPDINNQVSTPTRSKNKMKNCPCVRKYVIKCNNKISIFKTWLKTSRLQYGSR